MSFRLFVPSEFHTLSLYTWLEQFEYAMSIRNQYPVTAFYSLLDTGPERWNYICKHISNIEQVVEAKHFLDNFVPPSNCLFCRTSRPVSVANVIKLITLASYQRRSRPLIKKINQIKIEIKYSQRRLKYKIKIEQNLKQKIKDIEENTNEENTNEENTNEENTNEENTNEENTPVSKYFCNKLKQELVITFRESLVLKAEIKKYKRTIRINRRCLRNMRPT